MNRVRRFVVLAVLSGLGLAPLLGAAADPRPALPLFDAHLHYNQEPVAHFPVDKVLAFEGALTHYMKSQQPALMARIEDTKDLSADDEKALAAAVEDFKKTGTY